eukprot:15482922-Alexandrium_andersonii.AAC.1
MRKNDFISRKEVGNGAGRPSSLLEQGGSNKSGFISTELGQHRQTTQRRNNVQATQPHPTPLVRQQKVGHNRVTQPLPGSLAKPAKSANSAFNTAPMDPDTPDGSTTSGTGRHDDFGPALEKQEELKPSDSFLPLG